MIVFYTHQKKATQVVSLLQDTCDTTCAANCLKPKSKCCNKYKKKGVNCKRCPLTVSLKAVS